MEDCTNLLTLTKNTRGGAGLSVRAPASEQLAHVTHVAAVLHVAVYCVLHYTNALYSILRHVRAYCTLLYVIASHGTQEYII